MFSIIIPPNSEPATRRSHKKSRTGCRACKERKLKCDEHKPICNNCLRHFKSPTPQICIYTPRVLPQENAPRAIAPAVSSSSRIETSSSSDLRSDEREMALPESLRGEMLDPFASHPPTKVKDVDILMKFYLQKALYATFPWQPPSPTNPTQTFFVPLILHDTLLFHAILQLSSFRLAQSPSKSQSQTQRHIFINAECIRLLRDRVEKEGGGGGSMGVSDETISAVATLAGIEHERGNMKMVRMHLEGLRRMVSIRGGLNTIRESNPMVSNSVFWAFAVALYECPYPNLDPTLPPFFPDHHNLTLPIISIFQDFGPTRTEPAVLDGVDPHVAVIVNSIQHVSQLVPTNAAYPTASTSLIILTRMCTLLSHLLSLPGKPRNQGPWGSVVSESARFATLLHVITPWRGLPPDGTLTISHLLHRLMDTLKQVLSNSTRRSNTLLLWLLSVGGVSAAQMPERTWFVSHLVEMTEEMNIFEWEQMKVHVSSVIWHERLCGNSHRKLWEEVVAKRKELDEGMGVNRDNKN